MNDYNVLLEKYNKLLGKYNEEHSNLINYRIMLKEREKNFSTFLDFFRFLFKILH